MLELKLNLSRHCIEADIRRHYHRAMSDYFSADKENRAPIEARIALAQLALETLDFGSLRSIHRQLAGGTAAAVALSMRDGRLEINVDGNMIAPILRK